MNILLARSVALLLFAVAATLGTTAWAAKIAFIRDAEIETTIRNYATPLFTAAGLDADAVRVLLVNDRALNAFVAGGMNLFINTGLLMRVESPSQLIGVIAHETGHIAGGHLARTEEALRGASAATILSYVLGAAAAVAGSGDAAIAIIAGGQSIGRQSFLQYSRTQERSADQFAVTTLDRTDQSSRGFLEFLEILGDQDVLPTSQQAQYARTHPLAQDRVIFVRNHVAGSRSSDVEDTAENVTAFLRMQAKLHGFLDPTGRVLKQFPETDTSVEARYARSVAYYRRVDIPNALAEVDSLIAEDPVDPYFHELKGQILFENGRILESTTSYQAAVDRLPGSPLLRIGLARALIEVGDPAMLGAARGHLETAVTLNQNSATAWRLLSIVYGRSDEPGRSALASAEFALLTGRYKDALRFADRADNFLAFGSPSQLRVQDIRYTAENALKKKKR